MKNLNVIQTPRARLDKNIVGQCIDADNKRVLLLTEDVEVFEVQNNEVRNVVLSSDTEDTFQLTCLRRQEVVLIDYIVESGSIFIALRDGRIISIGVSPFSPPSRCVYTHDKEVCSVKLSPDQDLIALSDVKNNIFILTTDFSILHSDNALTQTNGAHKPVGVGWGSKETQFFGLDGRVPKEKAAKDQLVLGEDELSAIDKIESSQIFMQSRQSNARNTIVDWRGDGQLLATFTLIPDSDKHYLKVWNRNLELQYMSEQLVTMERGLLSWVPNGQYICATQRRDGRINEVAMFEKNGMIHQRITLPTYIPHLYIKDLKWSPDSAILAIVCVIFEVHGTNIQKKQMIMLYTMQNFHHYLKYTSYLALDGDEYSLRWDPNQNNILYLASDNGRCLEYNCISQVDRSENDSSVAVIDGNKILITPFSKCNIPPPMSAITIELENLISQIVISSTAIESIAVITINDELVYITSENESKHDQTIKVINNIDNKAVQQMSSNLENFKKIRLNPTHRYQNFMRLTQDFFIATERNEEGTDIVELRINDDKINPSFKIHLLKLVSSQDIISIIKDSFDVASNSLSILFDDFRCARFNLASGEVTNLFTIKSNTDRLHVKETQYIKDSGITIILTLDLNLLVNGNILASNCCTSFRVTQNFIVYTTSDNVINFTPLDRLSRTENLCEIGSWNQPIENGGTLVIVSENDSKVILQMPRGNLEILRPRIMVLLRLANLMDSGDFLEAMKLSRRYRVDLNFLVDYLYHSDEEAFAKTTLSKFANKIAETDPTLLNLFITELANEDTTTSRYQSAMEFMPRKTGFESDHSRSSIPDKVNTICLNIKLPPDPLYLQPRILCLLKQEPRKSSEALRLVQKLATREEREAALRFMLYFVSIEQLFLDAIATYDTDIALMVASVSSKDPKEYLALLDSFNEIEDIFLRRYKMDLNNKNYERAFDNLLAYLANATDKDAVKNDLLNLVVEKRIYKHAIRSCFDQIVNFVSLSGQCGVDETFENLSMEIWTRYADYLLEKRHYLEAGLAYLKSLVKSPSDKKVENAVKCFLLTNDWQMAVATMERHNLTESKKVELQKNISQNLMMQGSLVEAVLVLHPPKNDELAFDLVQKSNWFLAEIFVTESSRFRLREEIVKVICVELDNVKSKLILELSNAKSHYNRFLELCRNPKATEQFHLDNCYTADSLSTLDGSETSSNISAGNAQVRAPRSGAPSIKTRASSKSSRSQVAKQKKISLKSGSRHEDLALVLELKKFILNQKSMQKFTLDLLVALVDFMNLHFLSQQQISIIDMLRESHNFASDILQNLWPKVDQEDKLGSVYRRFTKSLAAGDYVDNEDLAVLMRPDLPRSCLVLEF